MSNTVISSLWAGELVPRLYERYASSIIHYLSSNDDSDLSVVNASVVYLREVLLSLGPKSVIVRKLIRFLFRVRASCDNGFIINVF